MLGSLGIIWEAGVQGGVPTAGAVELGDACARGGVGVTCNSSLFPNPGMKAPAARG